MSFQIEEINGKLYKIVEIKVDEYNTRRTAHKLTEEEYQSLVEKLDRKQAADKELLTRHKNKVFKKKAAEPGENVDQDLTEDVELSSDLAPKAPLSSNKKFFVKKEVEA